MKLNKIK